MAALPPPGGGVVAAAAPAPPIVATIAAPQSDSIPVQLDVQEDIVVATSFLQWQRVMAAAGAQQLVEISTACALRAFIRRCRIGTNAADLLMARQVSIFQLALTAAAWSRILTELRDSGLLRRPMARLRDLDRNLEELTVLNPINLLLLAADFLPLAPFNPPVPVVPAAGRGRGRGAAAAAVGVPVQPGAAVGPAELRFVSLCSLEKLQDPASGDLAAVALLAGMLGPCLTHAVRSDELSGVRTTAMILRPNLATHIGLDAATAASPAADPALASRLRTFVLSAMQSLGGLFRAVRADEMELQNEAFASFRYLLGSDSQRVAVEAQFIHCVDSVSASPPSCCIAFLGASHFPHSLTYLHLVGGGERRGGGGSCVFTTSSQGAGNSPLI